jgi:hypothetical protein
LYLESRSRASARPIHQEPDVAQCSRSGREAARVFYCVGSYFLPSVIEIICLSTIEDRGGNSVLTFSDVPCDGDSLGNASPESPSVPESPTPFPVLLASALSLLLLLPIYDSYPCADNQSHREREKNS